MERIVKAKSFTNRGVFSFTNRHTMAKKKGRGSRNSQNKGRGGGNSQQSKINRISDGRKPNIIGSGKKLLDILELVRQFEFVTPIIEQFELISKDDESLKGLAEKAKFPYKMIETLEALLCSVSLSAAGNGLHKIIKSWKVAHVDSKQLPDFFAVGVGIKGCWGHLVLEFPYDVKLSDVEAKGIDYVPKDNQILATSMIGSHRLDEKVAKAFGSDKIRTKCGSPEKLLQIMSTRYDKYDKMIKREAAEATKRLGQY